MMFSLLQRKALQIAMCAMAAFCGVSTLRLMAASHVAVPAQNEPDETVAEDTESSDEEKEARAGYERFLKLVLRQPKPGTAFDRVYAFHLERGSINSFRETLDEQAAASKDANQTSALWTVIGLIEQRGGRDEQAAAAFLKAETARPEDAFSSWYLGRSLMQLGRAAEAAEAFERSISRSPEKTELIQIFQELGRALRRSQQPDKAAEVWKRMEQSFPKDLRVKEQIATTLFEEGDFESALLRFSELATLHRDPDQAAQAAMKAAELKLRLGRKEEALADFESQLEKLDSDSWLFREARSRIEDVYRRTQDEPGLVSYYEAWLKSHPDDVDAMLRGARILAQLSRTEEARDWYVKALKRAPSSVEIRKAVIEQLIREEKYAEAIAEYEQLHRYDQGNADHIQEWGLLYLRRQDLSVEEQQAKAAGVWNLLLVDRPDDPAKVSRVAELLRRGAMPEKAIEFYRRAIQLSPADPQYREYQGQLLHSLQRTQEAMEIWNSIAQDERRTTANLIRVAELLDRFGHRDEGLDAVRSACLLTPEFTDRIRFAQMLREAPAEDRSSLLAESQQQLELAEAMAESSDEKQRVLDERLLTLQASGTLNAETLRLANDLEKNSEATVDQWRTLALYFDAGDQTEEALAAIRKATTQEPDSVSAWSTAAALLEKNGQNADAAEAHRHLAKIDKRFLTEHLKHIAQLEQKLGRKTEALQAAKSLIAAAPGNPEYLQFYADLCLEMGFKDDALNALRRSVRSNVTDETSLLTLARTLANQNDTAEAIELYWRAFEQSTDRDTRTDIVSSLASLHLRINQFDRLIQKLEQSGRQLDQQQDNILDLANAFRAAGDFTSARQRIEQSLTSDAVDVILLEELSQLAEDDGDIESAADYQRRVNRVTSSEQSRMRLANLLLRLGDVSEAEVIWLGMVSGNVPAQEINLAIDQLFLLKKYDVAQGLCDRFLQNHPDNWEAMVRMAVLAWIDGDSEKAVELSERLISLQLPSNTPSAAAAWKNSQLAGLATAPGLSQPLYVFKRWAEPNPINARWNRISPWLSLLRTTMRLAWVHERDESVLKYELVASAMPQDFGEARLICRIALWLDSRQQGQEDTFLASMKTVLAGDSEQASDAILILFLRDDRQDLQGTSLIALDASSQLAKKGLPELQAVHLDMAKYYISSRSSAQSSAETKAAEGDIRPDQIDLLIECFESLLDKHPEWLQLDATSVMWDGDADTMTLVKCADLAGRMSAIDDLIQKLCAEGNTKRQLSAGLWLALCRDSLRQKIALDDAFQLLDRIQKNEAAESPNVQQLQDNSANATGLLKMLATAAPVANDSASLYQLLDWWVSHSLSGSQRASIASAQSLGRFDADRLASSVIQGKKSEIPTNVPRESLRFAASTLGIDHLISLEECQFLQIISESLSTLGRAEQDRLVDWCQRRVARTNPESQLVLHLTQALLTWSRNSSEETIGHLTNAARLLPHDNRLHLKLVWLHDLEGQHREALAILDEMSETDSVVVKAREILILDMAMKSRQPEPARKAAERLYGLQLNYSEEIYLATKMRQLGMSQLADQVAARATRVAATRPGSSPIDLLNLHEAQGDTQAAIQLAQQLIRRTQGDGAAWRNGRGPTPDQIRSRAIAVLKSTGELERMIERQKIQLEKSPHSTLLVQKLIQSLEIAGRDAEVQELRDRMSSDTASNSMQTMLDRAKRLLDAGQRAEACDEWLKVLTRYPVAFWQQKTSLEPLFISENRLADLCDAILGSAHKGLRNYGDPQHLFSLLSRLAEDPLLQPRAAQLLHLIVERHPEETAEALILIQDQQLWTTPTFFNVLAQVYLPATAKDLKRTSLAWTDDYPRSSDRSFNQMTQTLQLLLDALAEEDRRREFRRSVLEAQQIFPRWQAGPILLILVAMHEPDAEERLPPLITSLVDLNAAAMPEVLACKLAQMLASSRADLNEMAILLLEKTVANPAVTRFSFDSPASSLLTDLYLQTKQADRGRTFIQSLVSPESDLHVVDVPQRQRAVGSRRAAARAFLKLMDPVSALIAISPVSEADDAWYFEQVFPRRYLFIDNNQRAGVSLKELRANAARLMTADVIAQQLQQGRESENHADRPVLNLNVGIVSRPDGGLQLESQVLSSLAGKETVDKSAVDDGSLSRLTDVLIREMKEEAQDTPLILLGLFRVFVSADQQLSERLTPAADSYVSRPPVSGATKGLHDLQDENRRQADLGFAHLALVISDIPELQPLALKMTQSALKECESQSQSQYLPAVLFMQGTVLQSMGDKPGAEAAWTRMLDVMIAEP